VVVYDTLRKNWTVHNGYTDFAHFGSLHGAGQLNGINGAQINAALFGGDASGKYYRLFETRGDDVVTGTSQGYRGGDIIANMISDSNGSAISTVLETPWLLLSTLDWKQIDHIVGLVEQGDFRISYRLDMGNRVTDWVSLGSFHTNITFKKLRNEFKEGYRLALRITSNTAVFCSLDPTKFPRVEVRPKEP